MGLQKVSSGTRKINIFDKPWLGPINKILKKISPDFFKIVIFWKCVLPVKTPWKNYLNFVQLATPNICPKYFEIFWKNWWVQNSQIFSLKKFVRIQVFLYRNKPGSNNYHFCRQKIRAEIHQSLLTQFTLAVQFFDAKVPVKN